MSRLNSICKWLDIFIQNSFLIKCLFILIYAGNCQTLLFPLHQTLQKEELHRWQENGQFLKAWRGNSCCTYRSARTKFNRPNIACAFAATQVFEQCFVYMAFTESGTGRHAWGFRLHRRLHCGFSFGFRGLLHTGQPLPYHLTSWCALWLEVTAPGQAACAQVASVSLGTQSEGIERCVMSHHKWSFNHLL